MPPELSCRLKNCFTFVFSTAGVFICLQWCLLNRRKAALWTTAIHISMYIYIYICSFLDVYEDTGTENQSIWKYQCGLFSFIIFERKSRQLQEWQRLMPAFLELAISLQADNAFPLGATTCPFFFLLFINSFLKNMAVFPALTFFYLFVNTEDKGTT